MSPRVSLSRVFLCVLFCGAAVFLILSKYQRLPWSPTEDPPLQTKKMHNGNDIDKGHRVFSLESTQTTKKLKRHRVFSVESAPTQTTKELKSTENIPRLKRKPWYFAGGTEFPVAYDGTPRLFPDQAAGDRVTEQLMYVPADYTGLDAPQKSILAYNGLTAWNQNSGSVSFQGCPVSRCSLTGDMAKTTHADAILYKDRFIHPGVTRPIKQIWILYLLESPHHTEPVKYPNVFNWTATYRRDSDLVAPYERWTYYDPQVTQKPQVRNYAANKTKKVAWFVSNCGARNDRLEYARELAQFISVDIYGSCGKLKCPRSDSTRCFETLERDYKFYLAFENSNCRDYITEKLYMNGLGNAVLPIVMGANPEDYERSAPQGSYIHVDDFENAEDLANYLHVLDNDDDLYNSYFQWKGTGEFINTYFWCRLCAMLHGPPSPRHYENVNNWWRGPGVCSGSSWRNLATYALLLLFIVYVIILFVIYLDL